MSLSIKLIGMYNAYLNTSRYARRFNYFHGLKYGKGMCHSILAHREESGAAVSAEKKPHSSRHCRDNKRQTVDRGLYYTRLLKYLPNTMVFRAATCQIPRIIQIRWHSRRNRKTSSRISANTREIVDPQDLFLLWTISSIYLVSINRGTFIKWYKLISNTNSRMVRVSRVIPEQRAQALSVRRG